MFRLKVLLLLCLSIGFASCISRLSRPQITGLLLDYKRQPIGNCQVGAVFTDKDGYFSLPEIRYRKFLLTELLIMEAPPVFVYEPIRKEGFVKDAIQFDSPRAGGQAKGALLNLDTIFLKSLTEELDFAELVHDQQWNVSFTPAADTLYLLRTDFAQHCKTANCAAFYAQYDALTRNELYANPAALKEGLQRRLISIRFDGARAMELKQTQHYKHSFEGPNLASDSIKLSMTWEQSDVGFIRFRSLQDFPLAQRYRLAVLDWYGILLIKD